MDAEEILKDAKKKMDNAIEALQKQFLTIRTGKANPGLVDNVMVEYYGSPTPINQVANVTVPEARLIVITPWEKNMLGEIERGILAANLGLTPNNDGSIIRIPLPDLTKERRQELAKVVRGKSEDIKVSIRNIRRDGNDHIKKLKDDGVSEDEIKALLDEMQQLTDNHINNVQKICDQKESEIMTV